MRKGIALQIPQELFEQIETAADSSYDGDRNEAIQALIAKGFEYESLVDSWDDASMWRRIRWAVSGEIDTNTESE